MHTCMLSHFSCARLFTNLWTVAHQAPLSIGFSRQEYWSGLLCPPPEYSLCVCVLVAQSCPSLCKLMDCSPPGFSVHGIHQVRILNGLPFPSPGDLPDLGIELGSPALQADSLLSEPSGKPKILTTNGFNFTSEDSVWILVLSSVSGSFSYFGFTTLYFLWKPRPIHGMVQWLLGRIPSLLPWIHWPVVLSWILPFLRHLWMTTVRVDIIIHRLIT